MNGDLSQTGLTGRRIADAFPIMRAREVALDGRALRDIEALARTILRADPRIGDTAAFGPGVHAGMGHGPSVIFGDTAEIPRMSPDPGKRIDYRMGWLAGPRDIVIVGGAGCPAFEAYQRRHLGMPGIRYCNVDPTHTLPRRATPAICLCDPDGCDALLGALSGRRNVNLHAHLTTGTIWALAARLSREFGVTVHVAGPPPRLSRRTNDKLWFGEVVARLLGSGATPRHRAAQSASALTRHVAELARKWDRLVVKVPDSAGSAGNVVIRSREILGLPARSLYRRLMRDLSQNGRPPRFPMLVEVWDTNVLSSPSVQTWIPASADGPPVIEGVFEQVITGDEGAFSGAVPADLLPQVDAELCQGAMQLATLFQHLGYFGRCSFDAIVTGRPDRCAVHWIECNGRWGGVSAPMSLVNRLSSGAAAPHYVIVQNDSVPTVPRPFASALREFSDVAVTPELDDGVLFLSPNMMEHGTGAHFLAFGRDPEAAAALARAVSRRLQSG